MNEKWEACPECGHELNQWEYDMQVHPGCWSAGAVEGLGGRSRATLLSGRVGEKCAEKGVKNRHLAAATRRAVRQWAKGGQADQLLAEMAALVARERAP